MMRSLTSTTGLALDGLHGRPAQHRGALLGDVPAGYLEVGLTVVGVRPAQQHSRRRQENRQTSPISATITAARTGPIRQGLDGAVPVMTVQSVCRRRVNAGPVRAAENGPTP